MIKSANSQTPPVVSVCTVLLVEDDDIMRLVALAMLRHFDCQVTIAKNGQEALEFCGQSWTLVLMDCKMPILDGIEATRRWRASETGHTPIVALTGETDDECRRRCLAAGMDDYLIKPLTAARLQSVLQQWSDDSR